jgi:hypothetical protein
MNIEIPGRALIGLEGAIDAVIIRAVLESVRAGAKIDHVTPR